MMDSLILVNCAHPLPAPPDPAELAPVDEDHPDILLCRDARAWLERLLDAADHSGEEQVDRFLQAMEERGE